MKKLVMIGAALVGAATFASISITTLDVEAHSVEQTKSGWVDKFRQLEEILPTPNVYRTGSGAPGHQYWQQKADYQISVTIDDDRQWLTGSETITYTNNSPDNLRYLWIQLDQNRFRDGSNEFLTNTNSNTERMAFGTLRNIMMGQDKEHGYNITAVKDGRGNALPATQLDTVMRIDLPKALESGKSTKIQIDWNHQIIDSDAMGGRGGYEYFEDDDNYLYEISQWYPRVSAYTDVDGWNTKEFLGRGEFTLEFGDYDVKITVPADHIVGSTGVLQNPKQVLTSEQRARLDAAKNADKPVFIVTQEEALANQAEGTDETKTWHFSAKNVRDFAFATSRKFVWDAQGWKRPSDGETVMAMSFYPDEGMPLWDKYSTTSIIHTLNVYSKHTFDYPYPVSLSINGPVGGMEYPMITFNGPRPVIHDDGRRTYTKRSKYGLIGVIIHEVGHNWFPMIVDTDERNWTWMDEGLNTYLQTIAEREWEDDYPTRRADPRNLIPYMVSTNQVPIMTQSESIMQFGNNAYGKPSVALNILRETVVGRDQFDFAFKEYANRWKFKRPYPADFFRTIEDASGVDLDWFWRGWFYTTDHVDMSIDKVTWATIDTENPDVEEPLKRARHLEDRVWPGHNFTDLETMVERDPSMLDFYNENDDFTVTGKMRTKYEKMVEALEPWEAKLLEVGHNIYFVEFSNHGGLVMPVLLDVEFTDGSTEHVRIPAEIWRSNPRNITKAFVTSKEVASITLDPKLETADADVSNNNWPRRAVETRLQLFKRDDARDLMNEVYEDENPEKDPDDEEKDEDATEN